MSRAEPHLDGEACLRTERGRIVALIERELPVFYAEAELLPLERVAEFGALASGIQSLQALRDDLLDRGAEPSALPSERVVTLERDPECLRRQVQVLVVQLLCAGHFPYAGLSPALVDRFRAHRVSTGDDLRKACVAVGEGLRGSLHTVGQDEVGSSEATDRGDVG